MTSIVIVGAGPNLGAAIARRFGREGLAVGLGSRDAGKLELTAAQVLWRHHTKRNAFQVRLGID